MSSAPITTKFQANAPVIMRHIMGAVQIVIVSEEDAAAILGNMGVETGGFSLREEAGKPNKDSRGYGWCQWTGMDPGERRLLFEQWCKSNGYSDVVSNPGGCPEERYDGACFGYFIYESTKTWEKRVFTSGGTISGVFYPSLKDCSTLEKKTTSFMRLFERPGTPHEDWRWEMAREALRLYRGEAGVPVMRYSDIAISSGHSSKCQGAVGILNEVTEARAVVNRVADELLKRGVNVRTFHDDVSTTQSANLDAIVNWHNKQTRQLDVSVHFNAHHTTSDPMGTEVLWKTQEDLADDLSQAIALGGKFKDRGPKYRDNLAFLNGTKMPAVLLEICFVDSSADANLYKANFAAICRSIADCLGGPLTEEVVPEPEPVPEPVPPDTQQGVVDIVVSGEVQVIVNGKLVFP